MVLQTKWWGSVGIGSLVIAAMAFAPSLVRLSATEQTAVFSEQPSINREQARTLFANSLKQLALKQYTQAKEGFKQLEPAYPGLKALLCLHQAEAEAALGQEAQAIALLKRAQTEDPKSPFTPRVLYQLGQAYMRSGQPTEAQPLFETLTQKHPKTQFGGGALYYLGQIAFQEGDTQTATDHWLNYLAFTTDGRFSREVAQNLDRLLPQTDPEHHARIGLALGIAQRDRALYHLGRAPFQSVWWAMAQLQAPSDAVITLSRGLPVATSAQEAVKAFQRLPDQEVVLEKYAQQPVGAAGEAALWLRSDNPQAAQRLLALYPNSAYAGEASWKLLWPLYQRDRQTFLNQCDWHLARYGHTRSAPRVLYWKGKAFEADARPQEAQQCYETLLKRYPGQYYAFRAQGRLKQLQGESDPGWRLTQTPASLTNTQQFPLLLPEPSEVAQELAAVNALDDLARLYPEVPPLLDSWLAFQRGQFDQGMRLVRDVVEVDVYTQGKAPSPEQLKLLYPVAYAPVVNGASEQTGVNPWLIQAIMREESYYNPRAVSVSNARGLMQLLPTTAAELAGGPPGWDAKQLFEPSVNIALGSQYLGQMLGRFNGNALYTVAGYNAGPNGIARLIQPDADPDAWVESLPYSETRDYIRKVFTAYWQFQQVHG